MQLCELERQRGRFDLFGASGAWCIPLDCGESITDVDSTLVVKTSRVDNWFKVVGGGQSGKIEAVRGNSIKSTSHRALDELQGLRGARLRSEKMLRAPVVPVEEDL